ASEWRIDVGTRRPNPIEMTDFNVLTFNGRAFPGTAPLVAKYGDRVRIRFGNLSPMEHHPIHLHGYYWKVTEMDGLQVPESAQQPGNTVLVAVRQTRAVEFIADNPGEMGMPVPRNSIPMAGAPGKYDYIDMGGMFTILKVREDLKSYDDPGWYDNPPGTLAALASNEELQRDLGFVPTSQDMLNF